MEIIKRGQPTNNVKLAQLFEIEELEERVEFGKWSGSAEAGHSTKDGSHAKVSIKYEF
ncbi:hypothetical protein [Ulvibacterium marinum]|uniref:hypothetical protein n=1 Tax=Ulvibacterium marinum TaxID=2419782 RepID=UPI002494C1C3|nr:hypothetical protein [Ulvibacterium marinum]